MWLLVGCLARQARGCSQTFMEVAVCAERTPMAAAAAWDAVATMAAPLDERASLGQGGAQRGR